MWYLLMMNLKIPCEQVSKKDIYLKALSAGILKSSKGINVLHVKFKGKLLTPRDISMINFAIKNGVDFIHRFVESANILIKLKS